MAKETYTLASGNTILKVTFDYDNLNIHIQDSYQIEDKKELEKAVDHIVESACFETLTGIGYTRTRNSLIREWKAHNVLYRKGHEQKRTGSVDLDQHESCIRRIAYFFLSLFY